MAKTLKFNLVFGNKQIRTLNDLQENFSVQDVYPYFQNGLLAKWLNLQGLTEYVVKLDKINKDDRLDAVKELINIFLGNESSSAVTEFCEVLLLEEKNRKIIQEYIQGKKSHDEFIKDYFIHYDELVSSLMNADELSKIKPIVRELTESYMPVLTIDFRNLFNELYDAKAFYPICHMLTYEFFRERWLFVEGADKDIQVIYNNLVTLSNGTVNLKEDIPAFIHRTNKSQDGSWEEIEFPTNERGGKRCMVLYADYTASVRAYKDKDNEFRGDGVTGEFKFFDGLDYRHTNANQYLVYVEV